MEAVTAVADLEAQEDCVAEAVTAEVVLEAQEWLAEAVVALTPFALHAAAISGVHAADFALGVDAAVTAGTDLVAAAVFAAFESSQARASDAEPKETRIIVARASRA